MTHEERVAEYEREKAASATDKCGSVWRNGQMTWEGNAVMGELGAVPPSDLKVKPAAPAQVEEEKTPVGGWDARAPGVPARPRPASKETLVVRPRRR